MKKEIKEPEEGVLTTKMDVGTKGFDDFQAILLKKSRERSEDQKRKIDLLTFKYQMEDYVNSETGEIKTAGEFLKIILQLLHIQQNKFANYIGLKPSNLSKLINSERSINYDLALIFGRLFNHNPMLWIEIQAKYEMYKLSHSDRDKYSDYSLNYLIKEHKNTVQHAVIRNAGRKVKDK
jgi:addiction module HigA family antidote